MKALLRTSSAAIALILASIAQATEPAPAATKTFPAVSVHASDIQVVDTPSVKMHVTRAELDHRNVTDSSDALKYAPNMQVRKRYIGDPNAVISGRNAGTLQSARSLVYADGLLLSNLMTNGYDGAPRWGMVAPQEIGAVDVLYGPYSALYPGNSMGTTVLIHTLLPTKLTASASMQVFSQDFADAYGSGGHYNGQQAAATLGDKRGRWSWLLEVSRLDNHGQPMQYATARSGGNAATAVPVTGAVLDRNPNGAPRLVYGANSIEHTTQTQGKLKVGADLGPRVDALFTLGWWHNRADDTTTSRLRDATGSVVTDGVIASHDAVWTLPASGLAPSAAEDTHVLYGAEFNGRLDNGWRWTAVASAYDLARSRTATADGAAGSGADTGSIADRSGSGWGTLDLRSSGPLSETHMLYAGVHADRYVLDSHVRAASHWRGVADGALTGRFDGRTQTRALYVQDVWSFADAWALTAGARLEQWRAYGGRRGDADITVAYADRQRTDVSPKLALNWDFADGWGLRLAHGKAVRYPTVTELFQGTLSANAIVNNNPDLRPEIDHSTDLTLNRDSGRGHWRVSLFADHIANSLYTQTDITTTPTVTSVQNIDKVRIRGIETALTLNDVGLQGLDLQASLALTQARTLRDQQFAPAEGKAFPRIPKLRASVLADYRFAPDWNASIGIRHSGRQYGTLDNRDFIDTYGAVSAFTVADATVRWAFAPGWSASLGVDNLNNRKYWVYHPYAGRTWLAKLGWDL